MKKARCLFLVILCIISTMPAMADMDIHLMPGMANVQKEDAAERALSFLEEQIGFSRQEWITEIESMYFGPGNQWLGKTEENCWIVTLKNAMPMQAAVQLHGKTGEIVSWECSGGEKLTDVFEDIPGVKQQHFYDVMPESKEWLNAKAFYERAFADFAYHSGISPMDLDDNMAVRVAYGRADHNGWLMLDEKKEGEVIQYHISSILSSKSPGEEEQWFYSVTYSCENGEILTQVLYCNDEQKAFRMNPLKTK